jgi:outer membrane lipoprotein carrier protein
MPRPYPGTAFMLRNPLIRGACALLCALGVMGAGGVTAVAQAPCREDTLNRVQSAYQGISSFSGRFTQEDQQADGKVLSAQGQVAYQKPGRMRWNYEPPNEQLVVTDGETVWLYDPLLDNVTIQPLEDVTQGTPLAFLLGVGNLTRDFSCRPLSRDVPRGGLAWLELVPRKAIPTLDFIQIGVSAESAALQSMRIVDTQGNVREVRLIGLRQGVTFAPGFFTFTVTDEMEVISN